MDRGPPRDPAFVIDLESGAGVSPNPSSYENLPKIDFNKLREGGNRLKNRGWEEDKERET